MGHVSWVTRVTGQLTDGSRGSLVIKCDPLSALVRGHDKMRSGAHLRGGMPLVSFNHVTDPHFVTFSSSLYTTIPNPTPKLTLTLTQILTLTITLTLTLTLIITLPVTYSDHWSADRPQRSVNCPRADPFRSAFCRAPTVRVRACLTGPLQPLTQHWRHLRIVMRCLQLRLDFDSTAVRWLVKGHQGHSDVTR